MLASSPCTLLFVCATLCVCGQQTWHEWWAGFAGFEAGIVHGGYGLGYAVTAQLTLLVLKLRPRTRYLHTRDAQNLPASQLPATDAANCAIRMVVMMIGERPNAKVSHPAEPSWLHRLVRLCCCLVLRLSSRFAFDKSLRISDPASKSRIGSGFRASAQPSIPA